MRSEFVSLVFREIIFFQCCFLTASRLSCTQSPVAVNIHLRETMDHGVAPVHNTAAYVEKPDCLVRRKEKACAYFCFNNLNFRSWDAHRLRNQKSLLGQVAHMAFHSLIQMPPRLIYSITMHLTVNITVVTYLGTELTAVIKMIMVMLRRSPYASSSWLQTAPSSAPSMILLC